MDLTKLSDAQLDAAIARLNTNPTRAERDIGVAAAREKSRRAPGKAAAAADQRRHDMERRRAESVYRAAGLDPEADKAAFERWLDDQRRADAAALLERQQEAARLMTARRF